MKFEVRRSDFVPLGSPDIHFILAACALACLGFVMVASSSVEVASDRFGQPFSFAIKHAFFLTIAAAGGTRRLFDTNTLVVPLRYSFLAVLNGASRHHSDSRCWLNSQGGDPLVESRSLQLATVGNCEIYDDAVLGIVPGSTP